jgi:glycosyltransferase XagB
MHGCPHAVGCGQVTSTGQRPPVTIHAPEPLPPGIAFLSGYGLERAALAAVSGRAAGLNLPAAQVAIAEGLISEADYYRSLAQHLGVPFQENPQPLHELLKMPAAFRAGVVALPQAERGFALAPEGAMLDKLIASSPALRARIVLTTPTALARAIRHVARREIAEAAANALPKATPLLSARTPATRGQRMTVATIVLLLSFFGTLEPLATLVVCGLVLGPFFLGLATVRMAATFEPETDLPRQAARPLDDARLPLYTVLVPLYRELAVLPQLMAGLSALDYPAAKLDVKILLECDDHAMIEAVSRMGCPPFISTIIVPEGQPRTKPRALNAGLMEARGSLLTIYDAEDVPDPGQLRIAAAILARSPRRIACIQARLAIENAGENWLTRCFALEYAGLFDVINPGLLRSGLPFLLGGTSNHFRTDVLREVGGWDAWNVTEDADLAVRLVRAGHELGDCPSHTLEEAPVGLGGWMRQRRRWMKGFMQTTATHSRAPLRLIGEIGIARAAALAALSIGTVLSAMVYPIFLVLSVLAFRQGDVLAPQTVGQIVASSLAITLFGAGLLAMFGPPLVGVVRRRQYRLLAALPLLPVYALLVSVAAWWALLDWMITPFHWHKTEHGLSRKTGQAKSTAPMSHQA